MNQNMNAFQSKDKKYLLCTFFLLTLSLSLSHSLFLLLSLSFLLSLSLALPFYLFPILSLCFSFSLSLFFFLSLSLRYFAMQCLARVLLTSPQLLSWVETTPTNKTTILSTIETLTLNQTLCDITKYEDEAGYLWYTLIPNVAVLFRPLLDSNSGLFKLQIAAQKLFVATLQVILGRKGHDHVLISEGLVDYIVCLPWWSQTSGVRERSKQLLTLIRQSPDIHYEPPSLLNMSKAAVSVYYCGLDDVMRLSVVPELVWKILQQHQFLKHEIH